MLSINVVQREPAMYFCGRVWENTKLYMNKEAEIGFVKKTKKNTQGNANVYVKFAIWCIPNFKHEYTESTISMWIVSDRVIKYMIADLEVRDTWLSK